nr:hypothetical protein [Tanacetum cinerariifolium]
CAGKLEGLENRNRELSQANRDQVLRIKELKAALAQKDFALVYAERINVEQAQEKERLKISRGFCHSVSDLLKVYPDSPLREQVPPHKPSSEKALSTSIPPGS